MMPSSCSRNSAFVAMAVAANLSVAVNSFAFSQCPLHKRIFNADVRSPSPLTFRATKGRDFPTIAVSAASDEDASSVASVVHPPEKMNRLESEFQSMLDDFERYTPRDIAAVKSPRYRALYEGVAAGSMEPAVARAFMIVFNDMVPIRVAGRMIYRHLRSVMEDSIEARLAEEENIRSNTGLTDDEIDHGRRAFLAIIDDGEDKLTIDQLVEMGIVETALELFGFDHLDEFLAVMDEDEEGLLDFERFMIGLQRCAEGSCSVECDIPGVLTEIVKRMEPIEEKKNQSSLTERKQKYSKRYDDMVSSFASWEDRVPKGEGRMLDVLRGCFVGARNEEVAEALRIVYMDYSALRLGGDLVFKVMKKLVGSK
mmetsp:Transcript_52934/g.158459  ORF Transcript_52934/g.158459 Transcript_52934/m.158459 type:complete len:369 (-) Transcript_52934:122-1228(-)